MKFICPESVRELQEVAIIGKCTLFQVVTRFVFDTIAAPGSHLAPTSRLGWQLEE